MTTPEPMSAVAAPTDDAAARRRARRGTVITIGVLAALVTLIVLLTPLSDSGSDTRLTTLRYGPGNARLAADLAQRLGWPVRRSFVPLTGTIDTTVIHAVFDGPTPMPASDRHRLLEAVRGGARLLIAPDPDARSALLDSLGLTRSVVGLVMPTPLGSCPVETDPLGALRVRTRMVTFDTAAARRPGRRVRVPWPAGARTLLASDVREARKRADSSGTASDSSDDAAPVTKERGMSRAATPDTVIIDSGPAPSKFVAAGAMLQPTVVAFPLGRGRVVALADPDVLRTDQLRNCAMGSALTMVRALEYLSDGGRRPLVFGEYYQRARSDGPTVVLREWLFGSGLGRALLTLIAAGLLLLVARGRRTLAPVHRLREERRSPLEHVDALATAWQAVRGTRTVARMLARGIRRRHAAGRWRSLDDAAFLAALAERHPSIADDVARLTRAIETGPAPSELPALRQAAAHIDAECLTP
ncbi:MAG TPA: hypothetical protein VE861_06555 [Gemmatimonadaceae bacterium]|nr:hypothetical protein [Gemmatimonadaceae bacterium]